MTHAAPHGADPAATGGGGSRSVVDAVAAAVLAVDGVVALHGGALGEVGTYLPGRRVPGIRTDGDGTEIHVTVAYGTDVRPAADRVRAAVTGLVTPPVHVTIEDVVPVATGTAPTP